MRTEVVELLSAGGLGDLPGAPPTVPAAAVIGVLTTADPMEYSGQVVRASTVTHDQPGNPMEPADPRRAGRTPLQE